MRLAATAASCALVMLTLTLPPRVASQKGVRAESASAVETSLDRLERELRGSVAVDFRQRVVRRTYIRLDRLGGCSVSFRVSHDPPVRHLSEPRAPAYAHPHPFAEWRVNLSDLDLAAVKLEQFASGGSTVIRFATLGSKEEISWEDFARQKAARLSEGRIEVGEKRAAAIAAALKQSITACRESRGD